MDTYIETIKQAYLGYWRYLKHEILNPDLDNYFYGLIAVSLIVWGLELLFPWRKNQAVFRKDFWLDTFYMFFNFFLFNLIVFAALSSASVQLVNKSLSLINLGINDFQFVPIDALPKWAGLTLFLLVSDFTQWNIHRLLHRVNFLWQFHKVHHSVKEMGFAAHLRFHWMETVVYKSLLYLPLAIIGGLQAQDLVIVHFFTLTIGHLNHANLGWDYGILKYLFNNPKMHIWHHSKKLPVKYGVNFGLTLSIWDYLFKTNYIPKNGRDIVLGFQGDENFPNNFIKQETYPLNSKQ